MSLQRELLFTSGGVPHLYLGGPNVRATRRRQPRPVRAKRHAPDHIVVTFQREQVPVAEAVQVEPFEVPQIRLTRLRAVLLKEF